MNELPDLKPLPDQYEREIAAYVAAWKDILRWKATDEATAQNGQTTRRVSVMTLLPPPEAVQEAMAAKPTRRLRSEMGAVMSKEVAEFLVASPIVEFTAQDTQVIFYPQEQRTELFPRSGHDQYQGFHMRPGGYAGAFVGCRDRGDGDFMFTPYVIGHEVGETIASVTARKVRAQGMLSLGSEHALKEGFCDIIGKDFYNTVAAKRSLRPISSIDDLYEPHFLRHQMQEFLDRPPLDLSLEERQLRDYALPASFVGELVEQYGLEAVTQYFSFEEERVALRDKKTHDEFEAIMSKAQGKQSGMSVSLSFGPPEIVISRRPELQELLGLLGYTPDQFSTLDSLTKPVDHTPEGAIACMMVAYFSELERRAGEEGRSWIMPAGQGQESAPPHGPRFVDIVKQSVHGEVATRAFGDNFSIDTELEKWEDQFRKRFR